jgi:hypothetical protein
MTSVEAEVSLVSSSKPGPSTPSGGQNAELGHRRHDSRGYTAKGPRAESGSARNRAKNLVTVRNYFDLKISGEGP